MPAATIRAREGRRRCCSGILRVIRIMRWFCVRSYAVRALRRTVVLCAELRCQGAQTHDGLPVPYLAGDDVKCERLRDIVVSIVGQPKTGAERGSEVFAQSVL